jgi:uncharacterized protein
MDTDLDRLIRLQQADTFIENARRRIADHPQLVEGLDGRIATANASVDAAKAKVADNQAARRAVEKDLAMIQGRLSKFKGQLMEVKTNKEYTAMLKEIEVAQHEVSQLEEKILEYMLEADELTGRQKDAEAKLAAERVVIAVERERIGEETEQLQHDLEEAVTRRAQIVAEITPAALGTYDTVRGRRGIAVVEVKAGYCTACHVRLRPQIANELRRNDRIFQCESCQRILYILPQPPAADTDTAANGAGAENR